MSLERDGSERGRRKRVGGECLGEGKKPVKIKLKTMYHMDIVKILPSKYTEPYNETV